jgi:hypothetical protein
MGVERKWSAEGQGDALDPNPTHGLLVSPIDVRLAFSRPLIRCWRFSRSAFMHGWHRGLCVVPLLVASCRPWPYRGADAIRLRQALRQTTWLTRRQFSKQSPERTSGSRQPRHRAVELPDASPHSPYVHLPADRADQFNPSAPRRVRHCRAGHKGVTELLNIGILLPTRATTGCWRLPVRALPRSAHNCSVSRSRFWKLDDRGLAPVQPNEQAPS